MIFPNKKNADWSKFQPENLRTKYINLIPKYIKIYTRDIQDIYIQDIYKIPGGGKAAAARRNSRAKIYKIPE